MFVIGKLVDGVGCCGVFCYRYFWLVVGVGCGVCG